MRIFFIFLTITFCVNDFFNYSWSRELSIEQIEQRKKEDVERQKKRDERGVKKFSTEINLITDIVFLTKERKVPAVLSNLDPILNDEGYYGSQLAIEDNLTTGRFLGHDYKLKMIQVSLEEDLETEFKKLIKKEFRFFILDLNFEELILLSSLEESKNVLLINVRAKENILREKFCKNNFFHIPPSNNMLADALTQFLVKKRWHT